MLPIETLATFFAASVLLALAPGPDNIFVLTQSVLRGKGSGLIITLGLCTGLVVHTSAVAMGMAVIFQTSAVAFAAVKLLGAGYLVYLAWQAFRASATRIQAEPIAGVSACRLYRRGIIMNITNPKVSIFFLAFLPQFANPMRGPISLQLMLLGALFILATIIVFGGIALLAGTIGHYLNRSARIQRVMNALTGTIFVALALKLATTQR